MEYNLSDIKSLLGGSFEKNLTNKIYALKRINANELLTHTRFDIAFKLLYLEMKDKGVEFSREVYTEHIRAFSLGNFIEPGNKEKIA